MKKKLGIVALGTALSLSLNSCDSKTDDSKLKWEQSRKGTQDFAFLEARDLEDDFFFALQVIGQEDFFGSALNVNMDTKLVKLKLKDNKLNVMLGRDSLMSFDTTIKTVDGKQGIEVDFSSAQNVLVFDGDSYLNQLGGTYTSSKNGQRWSSKTAPKVAKVMQTNDELIVDLEHTVTQQLVKDKKQEVKTGKVTIRLFLARYGAEPLNEDIRYVKEGYDNNYGYFAHTYLPIEKEVRAPIGRFNIADGNKIVFHIKDFPKKFEKMAMDAILAWNDAFEGNIVEVKVADENIDVADPRYNVVKWVANTDQYIRWAGVASPTFRDPITGTVISGSAFIAGDYLVKAYKKHHDFTEKATVQLKAQLGNAKLTMKQGETPVVPFFTDGAKSFDEYMLGYYSETITHEVGHILGLMHNFKASVRPQPGFLSDSVMDYLPRTERAVYPIHVGAYDVDAIKWGYYGRPLTTKETRYDFCTHRHMKTDVECNMGDQGNVVDYVVDALNNGISVLVNTSVKSESESTINPYTSVVENALKILDMSDQLADSDAEKAMEEMPKAFTKLCNAEASNQLSLDAADISNANLEALRSKVKTSLQNSSESWVKKYSTFGLDCL